ncbi:cytochrome c maturation protein CcmE [Telmatospirillum sp.]|uniref:cytochrome c maturation protein CcmE n=1 Tax=Telmatospirillum sp. TaxID=2079197 RepID=UPI00284D9CA1|nr:cytochrome c maturation protein CcmE [Telmatospirillum sp.]MDR3440210.1 cytochrome c maturation protein CcmE [Telmatospirillum sp.]
MTRKQRRLYFVVLGMLALGAATALVLTAMNDTLVYFYTPSDLTKRHVSVERRLRIGGLVEQGSVARHGDEVRFVVTDLQATLPVVYRGVLPDLFREGQGVVTEGKLDQQGLFHASEVLAKHDENYMPKEVADALKKSGQWQEEGKKQ